MLKRKMLLMMVVFMGLMLVACGQVEEEQPSAQGLHGTTFQDNGSDKDDPDFVLTEIFTGWGGLEEMWDSIDAPGFNRRFTETVNTHIDDFIVFSDLGATLIGDPSRTLIELASVDAAALLDTLIDPEPNYPLRDAANAGGHVFVGEGDGYMHGFYSFLDQMFDDTEDPGSRHMVAVGRGIVGRMVDRMTPQDLHDDMDELIEDIQDDDFEKDFVDVTTVLGKLLARADYPQTDDQDESLGLGNAVQGVVDLITWYDRMMSDAETRPLLRRQVTELASMFGAGADTDHHTRIRTLLVNLEDQFTVGGDAFLARPDLNRRNDADIYSDIEIGQTVRELFPGMLQLLMRSDRPHALIANGEGEPPVYLLKAMVDNLKALGYDPETADMETSLINMMRYDMMGRDRTDPASGAFSASHLESLLFLTHVTANVGWQDRNNPAGSVVDDPEVVNVSDARYRHGHGAFTGRLSLNDSLFSIKTHKTLNSLGLFDIGLKPTDGYDLHRSRVPFTADLRDGYRFFFDQNVDVLQCLAPPCVGDLGTPDGGNPGGQVFDQTDINTFRAYSPDGLDENQLAAWTLGLVVRACFNGEGPYYYADPDADQMINGGTAWTVYRRPNGKIYALVNTDDPENPDYVYPADTGDPSDDEAPAMAGMAQRYNRYKTQWQTDFYMSCYDERYEDEGEIRVRTACRVPDNSTGRLELIETSAADGAAGRLTYREAIEENESGRACASPEEALYRNYQWLMEEKKMVIIIPLKLDLGGPQAVVYQVLEANGITGLCNLRKYRGNHFWAKAGTNGESDVPGDYRIEVVSSATGADNVLAAINIYSTTLDCGHATPSVVGMNIQALTRLGFPRYTVETVRHNGIVDTELGSREFVGGGSVWQERSALLPPFVALISALRAHTPPHGSENTSLKKGIHSFVEGTSALLKPLIYYQKNSGAWPHDTWKSRVSGSADPGLSPAWDDYQGDDFLRSAADFNDTEFRRALHWNGTDAERRHFQPAAMKNLLNVLIDSDITAEAADGSFDGRRMDGLLPLVMANRSTTALLQALLSDQNDSDLLYGALEQLVSILKITKGPMTTFNETNVKNIDLPAWIFVQGIDQGSYGEYVTFSGMRAEDLVLDRAIDRLIGHDRIDDTDDGYGLACYVDEQEAVAWKDLENVLGWLDDLLPASSPYSVVEGVLDMNEAVFGRERRYEVSEIRGLVYGLGKLMTRYDGGTDTWLSQGQPGFDDLFRILRVRLPEIHRLIKDDSGFSGDRYHAVLELNRDMLKDDGAAEFLVTTMATDVGWEDLMSDASAFLKDEWVTADAPMWSSFVDLLRDLARAIDASKDGSLIESIYEKYGFQQN